MIGYYPINPAATMSEEDAFGPRFFRTHFFERMKEVCDVDDKTPVLELMLTSGQVLDVARIVELKNDYMLVEAFIDNRDCENTYKAYIRYITIYRINVQTQSIDERPIGFSNQSPPAEDIEKDDEGKAAPKPRKKPQMPRRQKTTAKGQS